MVTSIENNIKIIRTNSYEIKFNMLTGVEITQGINGYNDPRVLEMCSLIDIGVMGHCNNRCNFCYQGDIQQPNMKLQDYKKIILESKNSVMQVALGGRGNPDEHENFYELLAFARQNNIIPNYTTAGNTMTKEKAELSKMTGATAVSDYNENFTYNAINLLMAAGVKTNIHTIVSKQSMDRILKILDGEDVWGGRVDISKLNAVIFLLFKPQGRGKQYPEWAPTNEQIKDFIKLMRNPKCEFKIGLDSCMVCRISQLDNLSEQEKMFIDTCEASRMSMYITPNMIAKPCSFGDDSYGINLKNISIEYAWNSLNFNIIRSKLLFNPTKCPFGL